MAAKFPKVDPFDVVVFGGTGDLAYRKLYPALFHRDMNEQLTDPTRVIGVLDLQSETPGFFTHDHQRLLELTASRVAIAPSASVNRGRAASHPLGSSPASVC